MRFRLGYALELVIVLASGMALARWASQHPNAGAFFAHAGLVRSVLFLTDPFLVGVALTGGIGLLVESLRRQSPSTWGMGRRTWAVAALTALFSLIDHAGTKFATVRRFTPASATVDLATGFMRDEVVSTFYPSAGWVMAAILVTSSFSGERLGHPSDAREWGGRVLLWLIVAETLAVPLVTIFC
jgi:hypothetical protein